MASEEDKDKEAKRKKAESNDGGKMEIPIPPYLVTADIFCDSNFDGSVPPQLLSFFELTLPVLQRLLQNIETQLISYIRSKGAGAQAVALCQDFSRAMTARIAWSAYLQAIRTARKSSYQWIAAQALPRPLPTQVQALKLTQHFVDGIGLHVLNGRNLRLVSTMHLPNSVVPNFAAARFDRDSIYNDFAEKFGIQLTTVRFHDDIEAINASLATETQLANYNHANNAGQVRVWGFQELSYSFTDIAIAGFLCAHPRVALTAVQQPIADGTPAAGAGPHDARPDSIAAVNYF